MFSDNKSLIEIKNTHHEYDIIKNHNRYIINMILIDKQYYAYLYEMFEKTIKMNNMKLISLFVYTYKMKLINIYKLNDVFCFSFSFGSSKTNLLNTLQSNKLHISYVTYDNLLLSLQITTYPVASIKIH